MNGHKRFRPAAEIPGAGHEKVHGAATAAGASTSRRAAAGSGKRHEIPQHPHRAGDSLRGRPAFRQPERGPQVRRSGCPPGKGGQIRDLRLQVDFTLQEAFTDTEGKRVRAIRYKADFTYWERNAAEENKAAAAGWPCDSWRYVVEDVKSKATRTAKYAMKKKMLKDRFGYDITEV